MRRLGLILAAIAALAAFAGGAAIAGTCETTCTGPAKPAVIANDQASTDLQTSHAEVLVGTATDVVAAASAGANAFSAGTEARALVVTSAQAASGATSATGVAGFGSVYGTVTASGHGVANGFAVLATKGDATAAVSQTATASVSAGAYSVGRIVGKDASSLTQTTASANAATVSAVQGDVDATIAQTATAQIDATSKADITACCGQAASTAVATGNNIVSTGSTTTMVADVTQTRGDAATNATSTLAVGGSSGSVIGAATANANAATFQNQWGWTDLKVVQDSASGVTATSSVTVDDACCASSSSYGVGNTIAASNVGSSMRLDFDQTNSGDVSAVSSTSGEAGVGEASAIAYGNASSGMLCAVCGPASMTVSNTQVNSGGVDAVARSSLGATSRASAVASAYGNTASYYVSSDH
jgi:hypothetical protein